MKKLLLLLVSFSLYAESLCEEGKTIWDYHPIHIGGNGIFFAKANLDRRRGSSDGQLTFNKENAYVYTFVPIDRCNFFLPRIEYNTFEMNWDRNPRFNETRFQYMQFALTFLTNGLESWRWILRGEYNIDIKHFSHPRTYGLFSLLVWGTHELNEKWHYHIGTFGYTGFEGQEVYPIIGLDYSPNNKWLFQLIFPISYSIDYNFNERWRLSFKGRPLKERFRVGKLEPDPRSIFNYSTIGTELNLHYEKFMQLEFEVFAGYNFGGVFYLKDQMGHQSQYNDVHGAPYVGASLNWGI